MKHILLLIAFLFCAPSVHAASITLSWGDNSTNELGFALERCTGVGCTTFTEITRTGPNVNTALDTTVADSQSYCYRLRAFNKSNTNVDQYSTYSNTACGTTLGPVIDPPNAPSNFQALPIQQGASLQWRDRSTNETGFQINRDGKVVAQVGANSTTYLDLNLKPGRYNYRARAVNGAGESNWSNRDRVRVR